jgi:hypothetical protein
MMATPREGQLGSNYLINVCWRSLELNTRLEIVVRVCNGTGCCLHTLSPRGAKEEGLSDSSFMKWQFSRSVSLGEFQRWNLILLQGVDTQTNSLFSITNSQDLLLNLHKFPIRMLPLVYNNQEFPWSTARLQNFCSPSASHEMFSHLCKTNTHCHIWK